MSEVVSSAEPAPPRSGGKIAFYIGWLGTLLITAALVMSASFKFLQPDWFRDEWENKFQYKLDAATPIGILELACVALFVIPQTSILGAALITAYLGGATATHVRVDDPFAGPVVFGCITWISLLLRDEKLRAIFPFRRG